MEKEGLTYKKAGVDIEAGDDFVKEIKSKAASTFRKEVLTQIGGFGGLFLPRFKDYKEPVLVSSTDGVGTKLKIAILLNRHNTIGIDLVAMCVNDIVVAGAEPLFFLDYLSMGKLNQETASGLISGIVSGCKQAGCALLGGETAEMPGIYQEGDYDLAGFCVGICEREKIIDGTKIKEGDRIIGLSSSGIHSNGFSLVREVFEVNAECGMRNAELMGELLEPTRIYVKPILELIKEVEIKGLAHITGGGLVGNIPRILPPDCQAVIEKESFEAPPVFSLIQNKGKICEEEMYRVFNMGIGMVIVVGEEEVKKTLLKLKQLGEEAFLIGRIEKGEKKVRVV
ncbi:phosphoribosylformylglycinamidine cyclo-ligase [bacterium]|nr:phosphoribosylformylglycinamidine cyclo-ligase [bacterium]